MRLSSSHFKALLALSVVCFAAAQPGRRQCGEVCKFRFCNVGSGIASTGARRIKLRPPLIPGNGPVICLSKLKDSMGFVKKTGEPILESRTVDDVELSQWRPVGLTKSFAKNFFITKKVRVYGKSSIAKLKDQGNQYSFLDNRCIRLPILAYEKVDKKTGKKKVVKTKGRDSDCLAFRTSISKVLVELEWLGRDDLDLSVTEPSGTIISKSNPSTKNAQLGLDVNTEKCFDKVLAGKENVRYFPDADMEKGKYTVEVRHFDNCGDGPTKWTLRITIEGKLKKVKTGKSNGDFSSLVVRTSFRI